MKINIYVPIVILVASFLPHTLSAQDYTDSGETGFYGYTTIYYSPGSLMVTAYTETDLYGNANYYYEAKAVVTSNGHSYTAVSPNPNTTYISASVVYQGVAGQTYTATGVHSAVPAIKYLGLNLNDYYGMQNWASYDILSEFQYPFTAFSPETDPSGSPIELGSTYDTAEATIPTTCGDERSTIIQEYVTYRTPYDPQCSEFTQVSTDPSIPFSQLNWGTYSWAIIRSYFLTQLDLAHSAIVQNSLPFTINSAYRNPAKESSVSVSQPGGRYHPGSRHQYGDAVDFATNSSDWASFQQIGHQYQACVEPTFVQGGSTAHAHLDWRTKATVGPLSSSCPKGW